MKLKWAWLRLHDTPPHIYLAEECVALYAADTGMDVKCNHCGYSLKFKGDRECVENMC